MGPGPGLLLFRGFGSEGRGAEAEVGIQVMRKLVTIAEVDTNKCDFHPI